MGQRRQTLTYGKRQISNLHLCLHPIDLLPHTSWGQCRQGDLVGDCRKLPAGVHGLTT